MIKAYTKGKTGIFIDASNIYFSQKELNWQIDFVRLLKYLKSETRVWKAYYYTAHDPSHVAQVKFLDFLEIAGYEVRTKKVKFIHGRDNKEVRKGNLDVELSIDAVFNKDKFDTFLLFSGDSDFEALIKFLKKNGKRCIVFSIKGHVSRELLKQAKFVDIKKLRKWIEKKIPR